MTDYNNGKVHGWNGGECPVHPETVVQVWFRSGPDKIDAAFFFLWTHGMKYGDIIAFKVVKPYVEPPKPFEEWGIKHKDGSVSTQRWTRRERAEELARHLDGRAVLMREVIE